MFNQLTIAIQLEASFQMWIKAYGAKLASRKRHAIMASIGGFYPIPMGNRRKK